MANVVTDPSQHPERIVPDFSKPDPVLTFKLGDVAFVYGNKWKQRYFTKVGNDYFPLPAQWDVTHRVWRPCKVPPTTKWWVPVYPADSLKRPTGRGVTAVIRSITTSRPRPCPSGTSDARSAMDLRISSRP